MSQPKTTRNALRGAAPDCIAWLVLAALVLVGYGTCVTNMVGHCDDYWLLWEWRYDRAPVLDVWNKAGRWANGLLFTVAWAGVENVGDLWRPRLVSLVGIGLLMGGIYSSLRRLKYSWGFALSVAALASQLPVFAVYVAWATLCGFVYACLAAMGAFWLKEYASMRKEAWQNVAVSLAALALLVVAFCIYQPAAMFYVVMLMFLVGSTQAGERSRQTARRYVTHGVVLLAAMAIGFVIFKTMTGAIDAIDIDLAQRASFVDDPVKKVGRFLLQPVGQSCVPYVFVNHWTKWQMGPLVILLVGVLIPLGLYLRFTERPHRLLQSLTLMALIAVSYVPNLMVASDFFPHRTRPAVAVGMLFLLVLAGKGYLWWIVRNEAWRKRLAGIAVAGLCGCGLAMTRSHLHEYFLIPSRIEWEAVCADVEQAVGSDRDAPDRVIFVMADSNYPVARRFIYDEFGYLSTSCYWVTKGITGLAVEEVASDHLAAFRDAEFKYIPREEFPPETAPGDWVINARRLNGPALAREP